MSDWVPLALACGHLLKEQAWFEAGGGKPSRVECPEGCGMVEFVLPPDLQGSFTGENVAVIDLGYLEAGTEVEIEVKDDE